MLRSPSRLALSFRDLSARFPPTHKQPQRTATTSSTNRFILMQTHSEPNSAEQRGACSIMWAECEKIDHFHLGVAAASLLFVQGVQLRPTVFWPRAHSGNLWRLVEAVEEKKTSNSRDAITYTFFWQSLTSDRISAALTWWCWWWWRWCADIGLSGE